MWLQASLCPSVVESGEITRVSGYHLPDGMTHTSMHIFSLGRAALYLLVRKEEMSCDRNTSKEREKEGFNGEITVVGKELKALAA